MITRMNHVMIPVLDHEVAKEFYVDKLGFEVRTDAEFGEGNRWLTVGAKGQPDLEIILGLPEMTMKPEVAEKFKELMKEGAFGSGVFESSDIYADYEELKEKGVTFNSPPTDQFYGIEVTLVDPFNNWFSLTQSKK